MKLAIVATVIQVTVVSVAVKLVVVLVNKMAEMNNFFVLCVQYVI